MGYAIQHKVRLVTAASLFDGHDAAINIMRRILQSKGAEIIHLGHNRSVHEIVEAAIEEDVQGIAVTSYQGGHLEFFKYMKDLLDECGCGHIKIFGGGGGTILPREIEELHQYGIARIYSPDDGRRMGLEGMIDDLLSKCGPLQTSPLRGGFRNSVSLAKPVDNSKLVLGKQKSILLIAKSITVAEQGGSYSELLKELKPKPADHQYYRTSDKFYYRLLKDFAAQHRKTPTIAESMLWQNIRDKQLAGIKFRRQHIVGQFIADFISLESKLIIEIDGLYHQLPEMQISDAERTQILEHEGFRVIRFTNDEVMGNIETVKARIIANLKAPSKSPPLGEALATGSKNSNTLNLLKANEVFSKDPLAIDSETSKNINQQEKNTSQVSPKGGDLEGAGAGFAGVVRSSVLGITGTGGGGKSSVTDEIVRRFLNSFADKTVAVISVDPSRKKTGGALLGDRIRMNAISHPRAYMRSLATRMEDTALSPAVQDAIDICKETGFDLIILESAGVGQSDASIVDFCDVSMYVMTPEYGAASQLEKINMLDYADIICINKFDKSGALDALHDVRKQYKRNHGLWQAKDDDLPVVGATAAKFNDAGVNKLFTLLMQTIEAKTGVRFGALKASPMGGGLEGAAIIPANRTRYLSEIAENNRAYDAWVREQCEIASKLYRLKGVIDMLEQKNNDK